MTSELIAWTLAIIFLAIGARLIYALVEAERRRQQSILDLEVKHQTTLSLTEKATLDKINHLRDTHRTEIDLLQRSLQKKIEASTERSRSSQRTAYNAQAAELMAPYLPNFPLLPAELCFLGKGPVDYVGFEGLQVPECPITVWFIEIKIGYNGSRLDRHLLTVNEFRIKEAVEAGRVKWLTFRADGDQS